MRIGKRMILGVPAAKTNVKTANTRAMIIDNNDFLVVRPKLDIIYPIQHVCQAVVNPHTFRPNMIRVAHARNVRMESLECFLRSKERWT